MPSIPWKPFGYNSVLPRRFPRKRRGNKRQPIVPLKEWKIVRGDTVMLLSGKDKGKTGKVSEVVRSKNWVFVEGLNTHYRYIKPSGDFKGALVPSEAPVQVSEVSLLDPSDGKPTGVSYRYTERGDKVRVSERTGRIIAKPPWERRDWKSRTALKVGSFDTPAASVTKQTYFPSLLYFHEEIMLAMNVPPSIPKTKPERRDLMLKEVEKFAGWGVDKSLANVKMNWMDRIYLSVSDYVDRVVRFLRIDKL
ncbi:large ribosomal subunit protein uL24m-like [Montipora capricornis]|uniref:large ribosomal subunit protein uL24m-like n=1 Tax=Montipora capricornis TaxID=246305 RepID=UPI0035F133FB